MENLQLSSELERFFNVLRKLPQALERDVEVIEESVKEKVDARRIIRDNPLVSIGVAGTLGFLASGAVKPSSPASRNLISSVTGNPLFNTVLTLAATTLVKIATDKVERIMAADNVDLQTNTVDHSSSLKH